MRERVSEKQTRKKENEGFNENLGEGNRENDKLIFYNMQNELFKWHWLKEGEKRMKVIEKIEKDSGKRDKRE